MNTIASYSVPSPRLRGEGGAQSATGEGLRRSRTKIAIAALLLATGLTLVGQAGYIHAKAILAQILLDRAFSETISTGRSTKPWSWADTWPVARVEVLRLHESSIVLAGSSGQALAFGPGQLENTPEAGERGTAVYSAHRDTHFRFLGRVQVGDEIRVTRRDGVRVTFRVTRTAVARWDEAEIDPQASGRNLVLVTCWPLDGKTQGPLRYLVFAEAS
ncbi:sortase family protein [Variibacter gotjawalensis]|uniref:Sortase family protein n=1 Tax=Variibacter gotjawalensis TaxID=1333996 RepID=A0A0S3Q112_9BRAD|nr:class GN sortase [Variibacter gotjawalensis]NIK47505.1 sortase A [Variibacter gotjawalensis]RZS49401.1 sortase A [Variibacter gotjawalensis]BAT61664.1 sortase family protein [Variibacter gotjawalensis]